MSVETETERPLRADARRNRERIIEAGRVVFGEAGAEAQMDDVAIRASVGVGTVYRHFPTKEALMAELVREKFALFGANAREALEREGEPFDVLADLLRRNCEHMAQDGATRYALMASGEAVLAPAEPELAELNLLLEQLVKRARQAGTLRSDLGVADIPLLMCGVSSTMGRARAEFDWRRHLELVLDGLRAR